MPTPKFLTCLGLLGLTSTAWALDNQTLVDQRGDRLGAFLTQDATARQGTLEVIQRGRASQAYLTQSDSQGDRTRVEQGGVGNFTNVTQAAGGAREVAIDQREASQSHAYVYQGHGQRNQVEIVQNGLQSEALVRQGGDDQRLRIEQQGARNELNLFQDGRDSAARLRQVGEDHVQDVLSLGVRNEVELLQGGAANRAVVEQRGEDNRAGARQGARQQDVQLTQIGNRNQAAVQQNGLDTSPQSVSARQLGDDNTVQVSVTGNGNRLDLQQQGNRNSAGVLIGGDDSRLTLASQGNDNEISAVWVGDNVELGVEQLGDGNAFQAALVSAARVEVSQQGVGQYAVVSQLSEGNGLSLRQSGQGNRATIQQ
ncbi:hypothetical protein [uncultured Pseudomonas sp.]|uniref:hypothetical protein n=1 Tax=uncultured Pseudomonas sp. TaxID=114707 RepID=UPI0025F1855E|nr:hypothetical protein [uncultured Pseudomonas sp.]